MLLICLDFVLFWLLVYCVGRFLSCLLFATVDFGYFDFVICCLRFGVFEWIGYCVQLWFEDS